MGTSLPLTLKRLKMPLNAFDHLRLLSARFTTAVGLTWRGCRGRGKGIRGREKGGYIKGG
jgi:hypothetical protein